MSLPGSNDWQIFPISLNYPRKLTQEHQDPLRVQTEPQKPIRLNHQLNEHWIISPEDRQAMRSAPTAVTQKQSTNTPAD